MLYEIFTKTNVRILKLILEKEMHIRDIADRLKCSPAKVHNAVKIFKKHDIIIEKQVKNRKVILPNKESILFLKIQDLLQFVELKKEVKVSTCENLKEFVDT